MWVRFPPSALNQIANQPTTLALYVQSANWLSFKEAKGNWPSRGAIPFSMLPLYQLNTPFFRQHMSKARWKQTLLSILLLSIIAFTLSGCGNSQPSSAQPQTAEQRNAALVAIAQQFSATQDLPAAQTALAELNLPNPGQSVLALAESYIAQGQDTATTVNLISLASALGPISNMAKDYLARSAQPTEPAAVVAVSTATAVPATATAAPITDTPTSVVSTATPTTVPTSAPTDTATPEPTATVNTQPRAVANQVINVRSGPGTMYPVVNQLAAGQPVDVLARNSDSTWWQVDLGGGSLGWVAASVVEAAGALDVVALAQNIPPTPTPRPQPTPVPTNTPAPPSAAAPTSAPAPTATTAPLPPTATPVPQSSGQYVVADVRLRPVGQDSQRCDSGDHNIFVKVIDGAGNPLNGVRVQEIWTQTINVTGDQGKGPGRVEWDLGRGGGGQVQVVDGNNNPISPLTRGLSNTWPDGDLLWAAGYCNCKPHPDLASCSAEAQNHQYMFAWGHYVYEVTFQRR